MGVGYLGQIADDILQAALAGLAEATTGRPPPSHVFLSHGAPALDACCDGGQLSVHLERLTSYSTGFAATTTIAGAPPAGGLACAVEPTPTFVITLARCVPGLDANGHFLPSSEFDDSAADLLADLWAILTELYDRTFALTLFAGQTECADVVIGDATPLEPEGGCGGWEISVQTVCNDAGPLGS